MGAYKVGVVYLALRSKDLSLISSMVLVDDQAELWRAVLNLILYTRNDLRCYRGLSCDPVGEVSHDNCI